MLIDSELFTTLLYNIESTVFGLAIYGLAYLSNVIFSLYYNIKILGEEFDIYRILESIVKVLCVLIGTLLVTIAVTMIIPWANTNGLSIPDEGSDIITTVSIIGSCLVNSLSYIKEAYLKMFNILKKADNTKNKRR